METRTAGSASGLEKRVGGNADTALQADSSEAPSTVGDVEPIWAMAAPIEDGGVW